MGADIKDQLLSLGFGTQLINKILKNRLNISALKTIKKDALIQFGYTDDEYNLIKNKIKTKAIPQAVTNNILEKSGGNLLLLLGR